MEIDIHGQNQRENKFYWDLNRLSMLLKLILREEFTLIHVVVSDKKCSPWDARLGIVFFFKIRGTPPIENQPLTSLRFLACGNPWRLGIFLRREKMRRSFIFCNSPITFCFTFLSFATYWRRSERLCMR